MQRIIKLGVDDRDPCCEICVFSRKMPGLDDLYCNKKGMVKPAYHCKKFSLDITAKTSRRKRTLNKKDISELDFSIN